MQKTKLVRKTTVWIFLPTNWGYCSRPGHGKKKKKKKKKKGNLKRETESFFIAAQQNAIKTNYIKTKN